MGLMQGQQHSYTLAKHLHREGVHLLQEEVGGHKGLVEVKGGQVVIAAPARPGEDLHPVALPHHQPCTACLAVKQHICMSML